MTVPEFFKGLLLFLLFSVQFGCSNLKSTELASISPTAFSVAGTVTYDWVPAKDNVTEGGTKLDYASKAARPIRRAIVQAITSGGTVVASSLTNDLGVFTISGITSGSSVAIRVLAQSTVTAYTPDSTAPNYCSGASWDVRIVDNYTNSAASSTDPSLRSQYAITGTTYYTSDTTGVALSAALTYSTSYTSRAAAPFAILDSIVTAIELVCQSEANPSLAKLYVNWSTNNTNTSGNKYAGQIDTSHYTVENHTGENTVGNLYILGKENVDTDEYDDHVIAHEFGHYLESKLYRSDSIGGGHSMGDSLDPRVAFGEGYGNALSAMTFNDPVYVDTSGASQVGGLNINMATAPSADDKAIYSERAVQHFLWSLYDGRDVTANSGSYDRTHNIMRNYQKTTAALTTVTSFAAYYVQNYTKTGDGIDTLFSSIFDANINAVCSGACPGTGATADLYDTDYDLAASYGAAGTAPKNYKQGTATTFPTAFWRLYSPIVSGANSNADHMQVHVGGYALGDASNKYGMTRWYLYSIPANTTSLYFTATTGACGAESIDMLVYKNGALIAGDLETTGATAGCPDSRVGSTGGLPMTASTGDKIIVVVLGKIAANTTYSVNVTP